MPAEAPPGARAAASRRRRRATCRGGERARRRLGRSCAHPRVEQAVEQVGDEVGHDHRRPRRPGTCPAAPSSRGSPAPRWPAARGRGSRRPSRSVIAPETTKPMLRAMSVVVGSSALRHGVPAAHHDVAQPLGAGGGQVVLAELVEQRAAHDQRVVGEVGQGQRDDRQRQVPGGVERRPPASPGRRPTECSPPVGKMPGIGPEPDREARRSAAARATTPASSRASAASRWRSGRTVRPRFQALTDAEPDADDASPGSSRCRPAGASATSGRAIRSRDRHPVAQRDRRGRR